MSEDTELQDSQTPAGEEETQDESQKDTQGEKQTSDSHSDKKDELREFDKQMLSRLKRLEESRKETKKEEKLAPKEEESSAPSTPQATDYKTILQLKAKGFSDQEVLDLISKAEKYKVPPGTLLEDEDYMAGVEAKRAKAKAEQASPSPTGRSPKQPGKEYAKLDSKERREKYNPQTWIAKHRGRIG